MKAWHLAVLSIFLIGLWAAHASAADTDNASGWDALKDIFKILPGSSVTSAKCDVSLSVSYDNYRNHMDAFREEWLYKDKSVEFYQRHSFKVLPTILRKEATALTQGAYGNPAVNVCHFRLMMNDQDKFGSDHPYVLLSWSFSRALASQTHWQNLDDGKFPELAVNYRLGREFLRRAAQEGPD